MVAGAFPIVKLGYLAIKQISKPIANQIKRSAKSSPFFSRYVCMPPAQIYHWMEVNFRLRLMGLGKAQQVEKLSESVAIELGAEMLGEFIVFSLAALTVLLEFCRSLSKEAVKEEKERQVLINMQHKIQDLELVTEIQKAQIRELQRAVDNLETQDRSIRAKLFGSSKPKLTVPPEPQKCV